VRVDRFFRVHWVLEGFFFKLLTLGGQTLRLTMTPFYLCSLFFLMQAPLKAAISLEATAPGPWTTSSIVPAASREVRLASSLTICAELDDFVPEGNQTPTPRPSVFIEGEYRRLDGTCGLNDPKGLNNPVDGRGVPARSVVRIVRIYK
jgi:hypothetical protein